ncbi:MAG: oxygenase MpaB family protein [Polymorphobacter sp.]
MNASMHPELWQRVRAQAQAVPAIYGKVDFAAQPHRFATAPDDVSTLPATLVNERPRVLADAQAVDLVRAYTMMGDSVADAYAALMPEFGFKRLIDMLVSACDHGVAAVEGAPPELAAFIAHMERVPAWVQMDLVEKGARHDRNATANLSPFVIRGAFLATFLNKYSALPMALTGSLSNVTAARRVKETATFFATTVLPGALERRGAGFKAAAMVRLMHSMVRFNVMRRPGMWDLAEFGVPIPQVDQMPAGLIPIFLMSYEILGKGGTEFSAMQRAQVELARYRCYLLGLPEALLPDTPQGIVDVMNTRFATLRDGYDDATCGALLRATMATRLFPDDSLRAWLFNRVEHRFSRKFFVGTMLGGNRERAAQAGVVLDARDHLLHGVASLFIVGRLMAYKLAARLPVVRDVADRRLVRRIERQLVGYGRAEFVSDGAHYKPAVAAVAAE